MPTSADLDRLKGLVTRLTPLTTMKRGALIKVDDWNVLVGALIEVAQAVLAESQPNVVPPHEHPDQVGVGWLTPALRDQVTQGPLADPVSTGKVLELDRRLMALDGRVQQVGSAVQDARDRVTEVSTRDLARQSDVNNIRLSMQGAADSRDQVLTLRNTLGSLQQSVQTAVDASAKLTIDGQPADLNLLDSRLKSVEELRTRLTGPDGALLDATALEQRLTQLTNTLVTQDQLNSVLGNFHPDVSPDVLGGLQQTLEGNLRNELQTSFTKFADDIQAKTSQSLAGVNTLVAQAVADSLPGLTQSILGMVRPEISAAVQKGAQDMQAAFTKQLSDAQTALQADTVTRIADVQNGIAGAVQAEFDRQVTPALQPLNSGLAALTQRMQSTEGRLTAQDQRLNDIGLRIDSVGRDDATGRANLQQSLLTELARRDTANQQALDARFAQADTASQQRLNTAIANVRVGVLRDVQLTATDAGANAAGAIATQLRGEMHAVARDEVAGAQDRLSQVVAEHVRAATADMPQRIAEQARTGQQTPTPEPDPALPSPAAPKPRRPRAAAKKRGETP